MSPYVFKISDNTDIVEAITRFCRKQNTGLCILNGNEVVANVTIKQPSTTPAVVVTFHGFSILSIFTTILPGNISVMNDSFKISLVWPQGHVVCRLMIELLFSAGTIYPMAATFNSPSFQKLPLEDEQ
ncbi:AT-hook motif nuclear-localized protein 17 [Forsythia ovata]|uniref:AT-hook motif nuclear-localized protein 17 n=1 Tax=Forsythia ovata TaxID=205694 RepID=A0ABD1RH22_9LAMI